MIPSTSIRLWFRHRIEWVKANPLLTVLLSILCSLLVVLFSAFVAVIFFKTVEVCIGRLLGSSDLDLFRKKEILTFLGIGMGGILLALQAVIANRRAKALEDTAKAQADTARAQAKATEEQAKANENTERGRRQERLKNAIEHLGHASDSVRLGGAYELFHLAKDTKELRQTIMDILCAHIRRTTREAEYKEKHKSRPSEEVQSLLTLMFVEEHEVFKGCRINLQGSWLNGADLDRARLRGAILDGTYLQYANLSRAHLQGAHLFGTQLSGAILHSAHLQGTMLVETRLQQAELILACLQGAVFQETRLQGAVFIHTRMQGVRCWGGTGKDWVSLGFAERIRTLIDQESDVTGAIFAGGLTQQDLDFIMESLPNSQAEALQRELKPHIGQPPSDQLPNNSNAITGAYTEEEAEKWIAEYEEAMSAVPKADNE